MIRKRLLASPVLYALLASAFLLASWTVFLPLHLRGIAQPVLAPLNALAHLLALPGNAVSIALGRTTVHGVPPGLMPLAVDFLFYLGAFAFVKRALCRCAELLTELTSRGTARAATRAIMGLIAALLVYSLWIEPQRTVIAQFDVPLTGLRPQLDGLRIVQLSDLHLGPWSSTRRIRRAVDMVNDLTPDIVLMTGDYVQKSSAYIGPVATELTRLKPTIATLAVLGNHDWWESRAEMTRAFQKSGIRVVDNSRVFITPDRQLVTSPTLGLCLAGIGDYWEDQPGWNSALGGVPQGVPTILFTHNPDALEDSELLHGKYRIDFALAGHTHGGQIWLPILGTPGIPSQYGQKYAHGMKTSPLCPIYISSGIGTAVLPLRFGVPPEITVFTLKAVRVAPQRGHGPANWKSGFHVEPASRVQNRHAASVGQASRPPRQAGMPRLFKGLDQWHGLYL